MLLNFKRIVFLSYPSELEMPCFGLKIFWHQPAYYSTIKNADGSKKQTSGYKSVELRAIVWNTLCSLEWKYKAILLAKEWSKRDTKF